MKVRGRRETEGCEKMMSSLQCSSCYIALRLHLEREEEDDQWAGKAMGLFCYAEVLLFYDKGGFQVDEK